MNGDSDLDRLIRAMAPRLDPQAYVFACLPPQSAEPPDLAPLLRFEEDEGLTLILPRKTALAAGLDHSFPCRRITLTVHSSLEAVGFIARIAAALAAAGISCNPVAGYFHDHVFVPEDRAEDALAALAALSRGEASSDID